MNSPQTTPGTFDSVHAQRCRSGIRELCSPAILLLLCLFGDTSSSVAAPPAISWAHTYDGAAHRHDQYGRCKLDGAGNLYFAGSTDEGLTATRDAHYFVRKLDPSGAILWTDKFSPPGNDSGELWDVAIDSNGNFYATGGFGSTKCTTVKWNAAGTRQWVVSNSAVVEARGIAVSASGNVFVCGIGTGGVITIKYNSAGAQQWARTFTVGSFQFPSVFELVIDSSENVYITGRRNQRMLTIKYDAAGTQQWANELQTQSTGYALLIDGAGNCYVAGDNSYFTVIKYDAAGNLVWLRQKTGSFGIDAALDLAFDSVGNVVAAGRLGNAMGAVKWSPAGVELWATVTEYRYGDLGNGLVVGSDDSIYLGGAGSNFAFAKLNSSGTFQWGVEEPFAAGDSGFGVAYDIALDPAGSIYAAGQIFLSSVGHHNLFAFKLEEAADTDGDGLLDSWELTYWPSIAVYDADDDPDYDGLTNLEELAFGLNPTVPDSALAPQPVAEGGYLSITLTKHAGAAYEVQSAGTLLTGQPASFSPATTTVLIDNATTLKVRDNVPLGTPPARFMRVKVIAAP